MNRIRAWLIRIIFGPAQSTPPEHVDQQLRTDHPRRNQP